jgi:hypothetical protein
VGRGRSFRALATVLALVSAPLAFVVITASEAGAVDVNDNASFRAAFITPGPVTINLTHSFTLACTGAATRSDAGTATIVGNGFTIDTCTTQPMLVQTGTGDLALSNVVLSGSTGAVQSTSSGNVSLTDSTIMNVSNAGGSSGGIATASGNITLLNATISATHASTVAIAIGTSSGNVSLTTSLIENTTGTTAYGISTSGAGNISLTGSEIDTTTGSSGTAQGALAIGTGNATVTNSSVINTSGTAALGVGAGGSATVTNSTITGTHGTNGNALGVVTNSGAMTLVSSQVGQTRADGNHDALAVVGGGATQLTDSQVSGTFSEGGEAFGVAGEASTMLVRSHVADTAAEGEDPAVGVFAEDDVTLTDSQVMNTTGASEAFGVISEQSTTLVRSTIARTSGDAVGIGVFAGTTTSLTNSTIADNAGAGILTGTNAVLVYSDVARNGTTVGPASVSGAGIDVDLPAGLGTLTAPAIHAQAQLVPAQVTAGGTITSFGSVIIQPAFAFVNCQSNGSKISNGYNFADDTSCGFTGTGDRQGAGLDAQLGLLADNGGPTLTLLPATASPLVNAIPAAACQSDGAAGITIDQRSLVRPGTGTTACDIGAVELQFEVPVPVVIIPAFTG